MATVRSTPTSEYLFGRAAVFTQRNCFSRTTSLRGRRDRCNLERDWNHGAPIDRAASRSTLEEPPEERPRPLVRRGLEDGGGRSFLDDRALVEEHDAIGDV